MALARLCQDLTTSNESNRNTEASFHAFVVNHWARPDSDREALLVQDQLRTWGIEVA